jgi:hypothetical protein
MANAYYDLANQGLAEAAFNWVSDDMRMILLTAAYVPNLATDKFLSDITAGIVSSAVALTTKTNNRGALGADNVTFGSIPAGDLISQGVIYKNTGVAGTSRLFLYFNVATGLILTTDGGNVVAAWGGGIVAQI